MTMVSILYRIGQGVSVFWDVNVLCPKKNIPPGFLVSFGFSVEAFFSRSGVDGRRIPCVAFHFLKVTIKSHIEVMIMKDGKATSLI